MILIVVNDISKEVGTLADGKGWWEIDAIGAICALAGNGDIFAMWANVLVSI